jgi:hypothetical protein
MFCFGVGVFMFLVECFVVELASTISIVPKVFAENGGRPETTHFHCFLNRFFNADSSLLFSLRRSL